MSINISIKDNIATLNGEALIVCGNVGYNVKFDFLDEEWHRHLIKTARFTYNVNGTTKYQEVIFEGDICPVPILSNITSVNIGVYAGELQTTTPALVACKKSILCDDPTHINPPLDVYRLLLEKYAETKTDNLKIKSSIITINKAYPLPPEALRAIYTFNYYSNLNSAIADINNDTIGVNSDAEQDDANVGVYVDEEGNKVVVLLNDVTEASTININADLTINLCGKCVSFGSGAYFNVTNGANVFIDGSIEESTIQKNIESSSSAERLFRVVDGKVTTRGGLFKAEITQVAKPVMLFQVDASGALDCNYSELYVEAEGNAVQITCCNNGGTTTFNNCSVSACSITIQSYALYNGGGTLTINNSHVKADGIHNGSNIKGVGVFNYRGIMYINNANVYGVYGGLQNDAELYIRGGEYSGVGHGGLYLCNGSTTYVEDATIKTSGYTGKYKELYNYSSQYRASGFYFGGTTVGGNNAYFDNCEIINEKKDAFIFAMTATPTTNSNIYMSNCTVKGDGQIRIDNDMHKLFIGRNNNFTAEDTTRPDAVTATEDVYFYRLNEG